MSTCCETLRLSRPVKGVRLGGVPLPADVKSEPNGAEPNRPDLAWLEAQRQERAQLAQERAELLELQNGVLQALSRALPQMARDGEKALIAMALEAVQKLVASLPVTPELIEAMVREALRQGQEGAAVTVLLHAEDLALPQRVHSKLLTENEGGSRAQFRASAEVTRGGCIVQSPFGVIDARRETKNALLKKSLLE
jgi:flagellar assembly protein FliH